MKPDVLVSQSGGEFGGAALLPVVPLQYGFQENGASCSSGPDVNIPPSPPPPSDGLGPLPDHHVDPEQQAGEHHGDPGDNYDEQEPSSFDTSDKIYGFSRAVTTRVGADKDFVCLSPIEAMVARFLANKIRRSRNERVGQRWFYDSSEKLCERVFRGFSPTTLNGIIRRLEKKGVITRGNFNRRPGDRTSWYTMGQEWQDRLEEKVIYFRWEDMVRFGLCEAVLLHNLAYWLGEHKTADVAERRHAMRPTKLSRHLPFSIATIKRALNQLERAGAVKGYPNPKERCRDYVMVAPFLDRISLKPEATNPPGPDAMQVPKDQESPAMQAPAQPPKRDRLYGERLGGLILGNERPLVELAEDKIQAFVALCGNDAGRIISELTDEHIVNSFWRLAADELLAAVEELCTGYQIDEGRLTYVHEILAGALSRDLRMSCHPAVKAVVTPLWVHVANRVDRWHVDRRKAWYEQRVSAMGGFEIRDEATVDLAPAQKARILRNGVQQRNRIGRLNEETEFFKDYVSASHKSITLAEEFFRRNPAWAPSDVLKVLDECVKREAEPEDDGFDPLWHARQGHNLAFLIRNLDRIVQELGTSASFPAIVFEESAALENQEPNPQQEEDYANAGAADSA